MVPWGPAPSGPFPGSFPIRPPGVCCSWREGLSSSGLRRPRGSVRSAAMAHATEGRLSHRGFASMNAERQRQIASMGGKAVPDEKRSFSQNRRLAAEAGRKGGQSVPGSKRSFSQNRELAAVAGRKGGQSVPDEKRSFSQNPRSEERRVGKECRYRWAAEHSKKNKGREERES